MKQVIFNVGGALSSYIETSGKRIVVDIGKNSNFSPVHDFMLPYFEKVGINKTGNRYYIDQLIISHPHDDHISDIIDFDKYFHAELFTVPNDNKDMPQDEKINWDLINNPKDDYVKYLREKMLPGRKPPLRSSNPHSLFLYYIKPTFCENHNELNQSNYANNISLVFYLRLNGHKTLMPGDLMKDGMDFLIQNDSGFRNKLKDGIDFLIAPHHGLRSSFSTMLFKKIKNEKTKRLNIISEKPTTDDSTRKVDSRYSSEEYCEGINNLSTKQSKVYQRKTSNGHILIDYSQSEPKVEILDTDKLIDAFLR